MLRRGSPSDIDALERLEDACFQERRFRRGHLDWILRNPKGLTLLEEERDRLRGAIMLLFDGRLCRVLSVAVIPEARRKGLATELMAAAERLARARGSAMIRLEVSTRNLAAIELYHWLDYEMDGVLPAYYSWGDDAFSMKKRLEPLEETPSVRSSPIEDSA